MPAALRVIIALVVVAAAHCDAAQDCHSKVAHIPDAWCQQMDCVMVRAFPTFCTVNGAATTAAVPETHTTKAPTTKVTTTEAATTEAATTEAATTTEDATTEAATTEAATTEAATTETEATTTKAVTTRAATTEDATTKAATTEAATAKATTTEAVTTEAATTEATNTVCDGVLCASSAPCVVTTTHMGRMFISTRTCVAGPAPVQPTDAPPQTTTQAATQSTAVSATAAPTNAPAPPPTPTPAPNGCPAGWARKHIDCSGLPRKDASGSNPFWKCTMDLPPTGTPTCTAATAATSTKGECVVSRLPSSDGATFCAAPERTCGSLRCSSSKACRTINTGGRGGTREVCGDGPFVSTRRFLRGRQF